MLQRVKEVQESDLRMDGALARNIQRVLAVTQADIDAAAAQGKGWLVKRVVKVNDPLDNMRGGTQLVIKQNSILPGQNVMRVMYVGGTAVVVGPGTSPLSLPDAVADEILSLTAFGGTIQGVPNEYQQLNSLTTDSNSYFDIGYAINTIDISVTVDAAPGATGTGPNMIWGFMGSSGNLPRWGIGSYQNHWLYGANATTSSGTADNNRHTLTTRVYYNENNTAVYDAVIDGTAVTAQALSNVELWTGNTLSVFVGARNNNSTAGNYNPSTIYNFKIEKAGVTVVNLVPVKRISDEKIGFYDTVRGLFFANLGSGTVIAGNSVVPTPAAPMDIICNNGVLKYRDTELPTGYRRILGMTMNNNCYYEITGFKMNGSDTLRFSFTRTGANACNVLGTYDGTSAQTNYSLYAAATNSAYLRYNGGTYNSYAIADKKYNVVLTPTGSDGMETDSTWTAKTFTSTTNLCIGTTSPSATSSKMVGDIHGSVVVDSRLELIPCERVSDSEIGYYDPNTDTFYEPIGTTPISLGYDYSHYAVIADGPIETIAIKDDQNATVSTATCENLLSIGNYTDEQDIISGQVTRRIGIRVFKGTEDWLSNTTNIYQVGLGDALKPTESPQRIAIPCSHFVGTNAANASMPNNSIKQGNFTSYANNGGIGIKMTGLSGVTAFKQWLADQYAAGTPVIIAYVLKTPVTEQVATQRMETAAGDNTAEITQAGMAGLELEVEYLKDE